jgi:hypothetical protein
MLSSNNREFIVFAMVCLSVILIAFETTLFYGIALYLLFVYGLFLLKLRLWVVK